MSDTIVEPQRPVLSTNTGAMAPPPAAAKSVCAGLESGIVIMPSTPGRRPGQLPNYAAAIPPVPLPFYPAARPSRKVWSGRAADLP